MKTFNQKNRALSLFVLCLALAGGGAGTAGAAFTGNKEITLPAETALTFKLKQPIEVK